MTNQTTSQTTNLTTNQTLFLQIIKTILRPETPLPDTKELSASDWQEILQMASEHALFPAVYEAVWKEESFRALPQELQEGYKRHAKVIVTMQVRRTEMFLNVYQKLTEEGVIPLVVKGLICRNTYPKPDVRISSDEDLLVRREDFRKADRLLCGWGFVREATADVDTDFEIGYTNRNGLRLEIHCSLFSQEEQALNRLNAEFTDLFEQKTTQVIQGVEVYTLDETHHMLYLLAHGLKHFIYSGFGIRQLCDMIMFAETYGGKIDWETLKNKTENQRMYLFWMNLFDIGERCLGFSRERACLAKPDMAGIDSREMLMDILDAGVYGKRSGERLHSARMTLQASAGEKSGSMFLSTLFPSREYMEKHYPYVRKHKWLLPAAWVQRFFAYMKIHRFAEANETVKKGRQRTELLKKYGIIS